ncbi:hypothetical protein [Pedobacter agri]|uniref:Uncharacterized protein n=1 Tax=Pedobacter agri TaxID=454586 RepID=A0A9X3DBR9_9SPHI|nr:hypothetical protein [Pedobacter agri]MCX3264803.1 hypothetical protein [Pedobacter agri]
MFDINTDSSINSDLPIITDNYQILHFDEYPILFTGTNRYGNKLLGSFVSEDEDNDIFRYFVIIVDDRQFSSYFAKAISYRDLIKSSKEIFVIDRDINDKVLHKYLLSTEYIPSDYLPLPNSFIPDTFLALDELSFSFSLRGKLADFHKALVNDVNNINLKIYNYLEESLHALSMFNIFPRIYSQPSQIGSYRLNFDIEFEAKEQITLFAIDKKKVAEFLNGYLNYVAYDFPNEEDGFLVKQPENSAQFRTLKRSFEDIITSAHLAPISTVSDILVDSINNSAEKLSNVTEFLKSNNSFDTIEVGKLSDAGKFSTIGYLSTNYKDEIESKLLPEEVFLETSVVIMDEAPKPYRILVFRINSETGRGGARLYYNNETEEYSKVALIIYKNEGDYSNSTFTKSLNENKVVDVVGIATQINGVYKKLECYV